MKTIEIVSKKRLCFNNLFRNYKPNLKNRNSAIIINLILKHTRSYENCLDYKNNAYLD